MAHHSAEKPHQCPHCEYKAVQLSNLNKHIMSRHTGEKPYQCPHCEYKSVQNDHLKKAHNG
ncbi:hypothetical protein L6232_23910, partial [Shewanella sp. C31]|nr:hypothetical protein [Shewanella electrica]